MSATTTTTIMSIKDIPEISRRKSEKLTELTTKVRQLKSNQVLCMQIPRTKKGKLNRQLSVKLSNELGDSYTVNSRMGVEALKQDANELYLYAYHTPTQVTTETPKV